MLFEIGLPYGRVLINREGGGGGVGCQPSKY